MKRPLLIFAALMTAMLSSAQQMILHLDFSHDEGRTLNDVSPSGFKATLHGSAVLTSEQGRNIIRLGNTQGYIDLGSAVGQKFKSLKDFTIAVTCRVDSDASLDGNGHFLWAFSTQEVNTRDAGRYHAYKLNQQRAENTSAGWSRETGIELKRQAEKGRWQHVVYTQRRTEGRLYVDGRLVAFNNAMMPLHKVFGSESPQYNWIGRAPFKGDAYLDGASIADVRIYDEALAEEAVKSLSLQLLSENLSRHDFLYTGEAKSRQIFKIEGGKVTWHYDNPGGRGEISDAILLDDGHIMIADQFGAAELDSDGHELWRIPAPVNTEIHTLQPIGTRYVLYLLQDKPEAKVIVRRISDMKVMTEFGIPVDTTKQMHFQFRCARLTKAGTLLVAHMGDGGISEWDYKGRMLHHWEAPRPWGVSELPDGDILCVTERQLRQFRRDGTTTWQLDLSPYGITTPQKAYRLQNGNTVVSNWFSQWSQEQADNFDPLQPPVQLVEVDPEGHEVWRMASWREPNLGPATTFQLLSEPVVRNNCRFGKYK